jgi:cytochrome oxidase Cu insertion factor (SCO1/SenC/PrrC family)
MSDHVPPELAEIELVDEKGTKVRLGDLWRERPIVLTFVRHFG